MSNSNSNTNSNSSSGKAEGAGTFETAAAAAAAAAKSSPPRTNSSSTSTKDQEPEGQQQQGSGSSGEGVSITPNTPTQGVMLPPNSSLPNAEAAPYDQLYYVQALSAELEALKHEKGAMSMELAEGALLMGRQGEEMAALKRRVEELQNFLNRSRKSVDSEAVTNMEYLKNCVWRFMATTDMSEKKRLWPVISTILNFTSTERAQIDLALQDMEAGATIDITSSITNTVSSLFA